MLPKPEKTKKGSTPKAEQLDLVETISVEDKLKHKRRWLYITLFFTIGLSLIFMTYRSVKKFLEHPSLPHPNLNLSLPLSTSTSTDNLSSKLDSAISQDLSSDTNHWSVAVHQLPGNIQHFNWSKSITSLSGSDFDADIKKLTSQKNTPKSLIARFLPQGLPVAEIASSSASSFSLQSLISTPDQKILLVITASGSDLSYPENVLSRLIPTIYWTATQGSSN